MSVVPSLTCVSPALSGQLVARLVSCQTFLFLLAVMNIPYCAAYCLPENNSHKYSEVRPYERNIQLIHG